MSIALESNSGSAIERSNFIHGIPRVSIYDSPAPEIFDGDRRLREQDSEACSSSSIGRNSDVSGGSSDGDDEGEVQSSYKGPLDTMDALEEVLPIKRGISKFYTGKSKSFTSLADVSSISSIKGLAKPEFPGTRKRKNLLAHGNLWEKNHNYPLRNNAGGISKKPANSSRSTLAHRMTVSSSESNNNSEDSSSFSSSPSLCLPPLHPQAKRSPSNESSSPPPRRNTHWRSFSLSDLQCVADAAPNTSGDEDNNKLH